MSTVKDHIELLQQAINKLSHYHADRKVHVTYKSVSNDALNFHVDDNRTDDVINISISGPSPCSKNDGTLDNNESRSDYCGRIYNFDFYNNNKSNIHQELLSAEERTTWLDRVSDIIDDVDNLKLISYDDKRNMSIYRIKNMMKCDLFSAEQWYLIRSRTVRC